jgi:hypothetical protein
MAQSGAIHCAATRLQRLGKPGQRMIETNRAAVPNPRGKQGGDRAPDNAPTNSGTVSLGLEMEIDHRSWQKATSRFDENARDGHIEDFRFVSRPDPRQHDAMCQRRSKTDRLPPLSYPPASMLH